MTISDKAQREAVELTGEFNDAILVASTPQPSSAKTHQASLLIKNTTKEHLQEVTEGVESIIDDAMEEIGRDYHLEFRYSWSGHNGTIVALLTF